MTFLVLQLNLQFKRGLRQGDPFSLLLFTLCMEYCFRVLKKKVSLLSGFKFHLRCRALKLNHLAFVDDILIFTKDFYICMRLRDIERFRMLSGYKTGLLPFRYLESL
ncbi:Retrovirus-related Pol polyprotein from type-1 retrotransposable element R2 [Bienertia sinuspersici]